MQIIEAILFETVGCLAEFPAEPFHEIAVRFFDPAKAGRRKKPSRSASRAYWHLLNLMEAANSAMDPSVEALELQAADAATAYDDVAPALTELNAAGVKLFIASSLSASAVKRFLDHGALDQFFTAVWNRENSGGVKSAPLAKAIAAASLDPQRTAYLTDTAEGLKAAESVGVNSILMMNDPDEAKRLSMHHTAGHHPAGGIVSLHELPDFVRFVTAQNTGDGAGPR